MVLALAQRLLYGDDENKMNFRAMMMSIAMKRRPLHQEEEGGVFDNALLSMDQADRYLHSLYAMVAGDEKRK